MTPLPIGPCLAGSLRLRDSADRVCPGRAALLILGGAPRRPPLLRRLIASARRAGVPVLTARREGGGPADGATILLPGTARSAFVGSPLELILANLRAHCVILAGAADAAAFLFTGLHAADLGYYVTLATDAVAVSNAAVWPVHLRMLARHADLRPAREILRTWRARARRSTA